MLKTSSKRVTSLYIIDSNIDIDINISNSEATLSRNNYNDVLTNIKPPFPPTLTINDLIKNALKSSTNNKPKFLPNAFIAYRMELINEYRIKNHKLPPMGEFSKIAKNSWNKEPKHVKDFYDSLVKDAKSIYKQNKIQFVLDKHMKSGLNYVENSQERGQLQSIDSRVTYGAEWDNNQGIGVLPVEDAICAENSTSECLLIQDSAVSAESSSFPGINFAETNSTLNDQEYIRKLEQENRMLNQIIDCLLIN